MVVMDPYHEMATFLHMNLTPTDMRWQLSVITVALFCTLGNPKLLTDSFICHHFIFHINMYLSEDELIGEMFAGLVHRIGARGVSLGLCWIVIHTNFSAVSFEEEGYKLGVVLHFHDSSSSVLFCLP